MADNLLDREKANEAKIVRIPLNYNKAFEIFKSLEKKVKESPASENLWKLKEWVGNNIEKNFNVVVDGITKKFSDGTDSFYNSIKNIYDPGVSVSKLNRDDVNEYRKIGKAYRSAVDNGFSDDDLNLINLGIFPNNLQKYRSDNKNKKARVLKESDYLWNLRNLSGNELKDYLYANGLSKDSPESLRNFIDTIDEDKLFNFIDYDYTRKLIPANSWEQNVMSLFKNVHNKIKNQRIVDAHRKKNDQIRRVDETHSKRPEIIKTPFYDIRKNIFGEVPLKSLSKEDRSKYKGLQQAYKRYVDSNGELNLPESYDEDELKQILRQKRDYVRRTQDWDSAYTDRELIDMYRHGNVDAFNAWFSRNFNKGANLGKLSRSIGYINSYKRLFDKSLADFNSKNAPSELYTSLRNAVANEDVDVDNIRMLAAKLAGKNSLKNTSNDIARRKIEKPQYTFAEQNPDFNERFFENKVSTDINGEESYLYNDDSLLDATKYVRDAFVNTDSENGNDLFGRLLNQQLPSKFIIYENGMAKATGLSKDYIKRRLDEVKENLRKNGIVFNRGKKL